MQQTNWEGIIIKELFSNKCEKNQNENKNKNQNWLTAWWHLNKKVYHI